VKYVPDKPHKPPKTKDSPEKKRRDKRRKKWANVWADAKIYAFCILGIVGKRVVNFTDETINLTGLSVAYLGFAFVAAFLTIAVMESGGTLEGKKKNFKRRAFVSVLAGVSYQAILQDIL
jgi:hypothetical protein